MEMVLLYQLADWWRHDLGYPVHSQGLSATKSKSSKHLEGATTSTGPIRYSDLSSRYDLPASSTDMGRRDLPLEQRTYYCLVCSVWCTSNCFRVDSSVERGDGLSAPSNCEEENHNGRFLF